MSRYRNYIRRIHPECFVDVDYYHVTGDSIASGAGFESEPAMVTEGVAWQAYAPRSPGTGQRLVRRLKQELGIGGRSAHVFFAERMFELTGRRSVFSSYALGSTAITYQARPDRHLDYAHLEYSEEKGGHLMLSGLKADLPRTNALVVERSPGFNVQNNYLLFAGGSYDALALYRGIISKSDITRKLVEAKTWWAENYGVSKMLIFESGIRGMTPEYCKNDQETKCDMIGLREAQNDACLADPDIINVYPHAASPGEPFNTIETNADGTWKNGSQRYDNAHYSAAMNEMIGKTAAVNFARHLAAS